MWLSKADEPNFVLKHPNSNPEHIYIFEKQYIVGQEFFSHISSWLCLNISLTNSMKNFKL